MSRYPSSKVWRAAAGVSTRSQPTPGTALNGRPLRARRGWRKRWRHLPRCGAYLRLVARIPAGSVASTVEIDGGRVLADFGEDGTLLGVERLDA